MPSVPPIRLRDAIVDPRDMVREYLVLTAVAAICVVVALGNPTFLSVGFAVVAVAFITVAGAAATPGSLRLTIDDTGLTIRTFFVFVRRIRWSDVGEIDVAEGWQGETVAVEVSGEAGEGTIFGLPIDPSLGRRAFVTTFGMAPSELRTLLRDRRGAAMR
ncbi:MAG: PH domain-containing protein [Siculibacillus sp.]|nr:PH domain-containing protein [Siculibacillus sp.]